jgi:hypothetical protein
MSDIKLDFSEEAKSLRASVKPQMDILRNRMKAIALYRKDKLNFGNYNGGNVCEEEGALGEQFALQQATLDDIRAALTAMGQVVVDAHFLQIVTSEMHTKSEAENHAIEHFCDVLGEYYKASPPQNQDSD